MIYFDELCEESVNALALPKVVGSIRELRFNSTGNIATSYPGFFFGKDPGCG
jgi:hypothetical protein